MKGWADAVWLQGERFGTVGCREGRRTLRDHDVPRRDLPQRQPQARGHVLRRHRRRICRGATSRSTRSRSRSTIPSSSIRTTASPISRRGGCARRSRRRSRSATTRCACCARPASSRRSASSPTPSCSPRSSRCASGCEIISAERIRDELSKLLLADDPSAGLWLIARTRLADEFLPELNAMELEQDPIHRHKDVLAHTIAVVAKTSPRLKLRLVGAAPRRRQAGHARLRAAGRDVPLPRRRRRADGAATPASRCATRTTSSTTSPSSSSCTCASTRTAWAGPTARCAATCATPDRCSTISTS